MTRTAGDEMAGRPCSPSGRSAPVGVNGNLQPAPPFAEGNGVAVKHGAHSEKKIAPLREAFAVELRDQYPALSEWRLAILADRCARWRVGVEWLDTQGTVVRTKSGQVFDIADRVEKWGARVQHDLAELDAEQSGTRVDLATALSEPHPVLRAALLRAAGIEVEALEEEASDVAA